MALIKAIIHVKDFIPGDTGLGVNYLIALAERDWRSVIDLNDPFMYIFPNDDSVKIDELWQNLAIDASNQINLRLRAKGYALLATCSPKDLYVYGLSDPKGRPEARSRPLPARGGRVQAIPEVAGGITSIKELETSITMTGNKGNILHCEVEFQTPPVSTQITYCLELHPGLVNLDNPLGVDHIPLTNVDQSGVYTLWGEKSAYLIDEFITSLDTVQGVIGVHRHTGSGVIAATLAGVPRGVNITWKEVAMWTPAELTTAPQHWYRGDSLGVPERITTIRTSARWKENQMVNAWRNLVNSEVVPGIPRQQNTNTNVAAIQNEPRWAPILHWDGINGKPALEWGPYYDGWTLPGRNMWRVQVGQKTEMKMAAVYSGSTVVAAVKDYNGVPQLRGDELLTDGNNETLLGRDYRGLIAEVVIGWMSPEEKEKVEGYLAHTYDIPLASGHPYIDAPPVV